MMFDEGLVACLLVPVVVESYNYTSLVYAGSMNYNNYNDWLIQGKCNVRNINGSHFQGQENQPLLICRIDDKTK